MNEHTSLHGQSTGTPCLAYRSRSRRSTAAITPPAITAHARPRPDASVSCAPSDTAERAARKNAAATNSQSCTRSDSAVSLVDLEHPTGIREQGHVFLWHDARHPCLPVHARDGWTIARSRSRAEQRKTNHRVRWCSNGMRTGMSQQQPFSPEHRARRVAAHERAAAAHEHAEHFHDEVAKFFDGHGRPDKAKHERPCAEPHVQVQWREQRDSGAAQLAADACWNAGMLSQAATLCDRDDDLAKQLLIEACSYCPPSRHRTEEPTNRG